MIDDILDSNQDDKQIFVIFKYPDGSIYSPCGFGCLFYDSSDDIEDNEEK